MKVSGALICVLAWTTITVMQIVHLATLPSKIIISGVDYTQANIIIQRHETLLICLGLALAIGGYFIRRWGQALVLCSSLFYLVHWFPFHAVWTYGLTQVFKGMFIVGSGFRATYVMRDIFLPILFVIAMIMVAQEIYRSHPAAEAS